jgi:hypothetical protein
MIPYDVGLVALALQLTVTSKCQTIPRCRLNAQKSFLRSRVWKQVHNSVQIQRRKLNNTGKMLFLGMWLLFLFEPNRLQLPAFRILAINVSTIQLDRGVVDDPR